MNLTGFFFNNMLAINTFITMLYVQVGSGQVDEKLKE